MTVTVRDAAPDDRLGVRRVLDAAMLDVPDDLRERIDAGDVLVASEGGDGAAKTNEEKDEDGGEEKGEEKDKDEVKDEDGAEEKDEDGAEETDENAPILGALVLVPRERGARVDAVAVRRARRAQGIGSALVRAASERHPRLAAEFDADVRPFYESLGFEIEPVADADGRFRGRYERGDA